MVAFFFLISVCLSIQNIVGTDFLKTAAVLRGLTFNFIKYYIPFTLHQQIQRFFFKTNSWEADKIQQKSSLLWLFSAWTVPAQLRLCDRQAMFLQYPCGSMLGTVSGADSHSLILKDGSSVCILPAWILNVEKTQVFLKNPTTQTHKSPVLRGSSLIHYLQAHRVYQDIEHWPCRKERDKYSKISGATLGFLTAILRSSNQLYIFLKYQKQSVSVAK